MSLWRRCSNELVPITDTRVPKRLGKDKQTSLALSRNEGGIAPKLALRACFSAPGPEAWQRL
jgi:hypothetical protein